MPTSSSGRIEAGKDLMRLIIRADASTSIGYGHVMRCLALAQAWQDAGGETVFIMSSPAAALEARLQREGMTVVALAKEPGGVEDALETADAARQVGARWLALDGYQFSGNYQRIIKDAGLALLVIDDWGHADYYHADIVVNQNLHAHQGLYEKRDPRTRLLLGSSYVLLRREFMKWRGWRREIPGVARRVLVTLGGGDANNVTLAVIEALKKVAIDGLEVVVVVGEANPHYDELQEAVAASPVVIRLERDVADMPDLMAWAEVAVVAGGSTSWELAFMGLPCVSLALFQNQLSIVESLSLAGAAINGGWCERLASRDIACTLTSLLGSPDARRAMSEVGQDIVDGEGANRVANVLAKGWGD